MEEAPEGEQPPERGGGVRELLPEGKEAGGPGRAPKIRGDDRSCKMVTRLWEKDSVVEEVMDEEEKQGDEK